MELISVRPIAERGLRAQNVKITCVKCARLLVVGALLSQAGLVLAFTQCLAWATMVRDGQTLTEAIEGRSPCHLCLKIRNAKSSHSMTAGVASPAIDWSLPAKRSLLLDAVSGQALGSVIAILADVSRAVDSPPPRCLLS